MVPGQDHVEQLLRFARAWPREKPLVIHCWAGISRSTAAAFIAVCALRPDRDEAEVAQALRAAAPSATPNARLVAVADDLLGRRGRMVDAIAAIGRGVDAYEGTPFVLGLDWSDMVDRWKKLEKVTKADVVAFAQKHLRPDNYAVVFKYHGED